MSQVSPQSNPVDYTDAELRQLADEATEAAFLALLPYFQSSGRTALNSTDQTMVRVALSLMLMRKVGRPIIA